MILRCGYQDASAHPEYLKAAHIQIHKAAHVHWVVAIASQLEGSRSVRLTPLYTLGLTLPALRKLCMKQDHGWSRNIASRRTEICPAISRGSPFAAVVCHGVYHTFEPTLGPKDSERGSKIDTQLLRSP